MHAQKKTVDTIVESDNHYVLQVKRNQPTLFEEIGRASLEQTPLDYYEEHEKDHGRCSNWHVYVYDARQSVKASEWTNLARFIHVHKHTVYKEKGKIKISHSDRYYISDYFQSSALFYHKGIREHWGIENQLHWVKDVIIGEDSNQIRHKQGAINRAVLSSMILNIHRKNGQKSISDAQITNNACNIKELFELLMNS